MSFNNIFSILQTIIVLGLVIVLANLSLKLLKNQMTKQNKSINIIERVTINNNSSLAIVEICGKYYLMSFTNSDNKILKELDKENLKDVVDEIEREQNFNYENPIGKIKKHFGMGKEVD